MMQPPANLTNVNIQLPVRAVVTLLQLEGRAPLLDAERLWLESIDAQVAQTLRAGLVTQPTNGNTGRNGNTRVTMKDGRQFVVPEGETIPSGPDIETVETFSA